MVPTAAQLWMKPPPPSLSKSPALLLPADFSPHLTLCKVVEKQRDACQLPVNHSFIWSVALLTAVLTASIMC